MKTMLILLCLALLVGCGPTIIHGKVVSKEHYPSHVWFMPMTITSGKITTTTLIPIFEPETWSVLVEGETKEGKQDVAEIFINHSVWLKVKEGSEYRCGDEKSDPCVFERPHRDATEEEAKRGKS